MTYTPEQIATAVNAPLANVQASWPALLSALNWQHINDHATRVALAATVAVETGVTEGGINRTFLPVAELGGASAWYAPWYGRGFIQCTLQSNYAEYGPLLSPPLDLLANPDLMLQTQPSAHFAALYFVQRGIPALARAGNWIGVREAVNGGTNGLQAFLNYVTALENVPGGESIEGDIYHVVTAGALKQQPNHTCPAAIGPDHKPVMTALHQTVIATGRQQDGWIEVTIPGTPIHGWLPQGSIR